MMVMWEIRHVKMEDLYQLVLVEQLCFTKEEAATEEAFKTRIQKISDTFFIAEEKHKIIGFINGPVIDRHYLTDDLFCEVETNPLVGGHQSILGLAVTPDHQKRGIASALLQRFEFEAKEKKRESLTLTCKEGLIPYYEQFGFLNKGISQSEHGGSVWYNMIKQLM